MMLHKSLIRTILWLLFQLLVKINCQTTSQRYVHTATVIDNKLYILGGYSDNDLIVVTGKNFFYLDVSVAFSTQGLMWHDLTSTNIVPAHYGAASIKGGARNDTLFLFGGSSNSTSLVYTYNPQSNSWDIPKIAGAGAVRRTNLMGVIDNSGKMYLWSGADYNFGVTSTDLDGIIILDTVNLNWRNVGLTGAPLSRINYGAVLLPNNIIIYMGGFNNPNSIELSLNSVYLYDTVKDIWNTTSTSGISIPSARDGFSAVLGLDGQRIIIYGGTSTINNAPLAPGDSLYVLNLTSFVWSIPNASGSTPSSRIFHKANVIGRYMVVSFGLGYARSVESDILLLDISNNNEYKWVNRFDPSPLITSVTSTSTTSTSPSSSLTSAQQTSPDNKPVMIGAIIGSLFGGILLSLGVFFLYGWHKKKKQQRNETLQIPGRSSYNQEENIGRENIYNQGRETVYNQGRENIYNQGRENIYNQGRETIYNQGRENIYNQGRENIYNQGRENIYNQGQENQIYSRYNYIQQAPTTNHEQIASVSNNDYGYRYT